MIDAVILCMTKQHLPDFLKSNIQNGESKNWYLTRNILQTIQINWHMFQEQVELSIQAEIDIVITANFLRILPGFPTECCRR